MKPLHEAMMAACVCMCAVRMPAVEISYEGRIDLTGEWRLEQVGKSEVNCPITVPGDVHSALLSAKIIPDPYYSANEYLTLWVGRADWIQRRTFEVPAKFLSAPSVVLRLDEVDTFATVTLNGHVLPRMDNRFRRWDFDVKKLLLPGRNEIDVRFDSAMREGRRLAAKENDSFHMQNTFFQEAMFVRKPACHGGWDWGPCLMTAGLLGRVELVATSTARIDHVYCDQKFNAEMSSCTVAVNAEVFSPNGGETEFSAKLGDAVTARKVTLKSGVNRLTATIHLENPQLWWPVNEGDHNLYHLDVRVGGAHIAKKIGLRKIELVTDPDAESYARLGGRKGTNMCFRVNGRDIFARGANWIPCDALESRQPEKWRGLVESAAKANMNMLRIWGGGRYEGDAFYEACDEFGVMLWHDFMFSCALYPDNDAFYESVVAEETYQVKRLRDHPSIALWCGDNECISMLVGDIGWPDERDRHAANFTRRAALGRKVVLECDPARPYWTSSPSANGRDDSVIDCRRDGKSGDIHNWSVYFGWKPCWNFYDYQPRFCSEFGSQSMPSAEIGETFAPPESVRNLGADYMYHQKTPQGNRRLVDFLRKQFFAPASGYDFIYLTQVHQALAVKTACEYYRSLEPWCMGALVWQLDDNWPVASWSSIEYGGKWKPLHYQLKRTFAPLLVAIVPTEASYARRKTMEFDFQRPQASYEFRDAATPFDLAFYGVNDTNEPVEGELTIEAVSFDGSSRTLHERCMATLPPRRSVAMASISEEAFGGLDKRRDAFLLATLSTPRGTVQDFRLFGEFRNAPLADPKIKVATADLGDGRFEVTLDVATPAFYVWANVWKTPGEFDDNLLAVMPGESRKIIFTPASSGVTFEAFRKALSVKSLYEARKRPDVRIGIVGADTSHTAAFVKIMNTDKDPDVAGFRVTHAYKWGSKDIPSCTNRYSTIIPQIVAAGVTMTSSIAELLENVDCVMLETCDGRPHLEQAREIIASGKPCYIDKPLASNLHDALAILRLAKEAGVQVFCASSLRYTKAVKDVVCGERGSIRAADTFAPGNYEPTNSRYFWYAIHGADPLFAMMGTGCRDVTCVAGEDSDVIVGRWADGRTGTLRVFHERGGYGGSVVNDKQKLYSLGGYEGYKVLLVEILKFFKTGISPIPPEELEEVYVFLDAARLSRERGGQAVSMEETRSLSLR